jgi:hypothetical protein
LLDSIGKVAFSPEPAAALLIHFGSRGAPIDRHHKHFLRPDQVKNILYVPKYSKKHFGFCQSRIRVIAVCAVVNNAVHVKVQIVKLRNDNLMRKVLIDEGIPLRKPPIKLRDSHLVEISAAV